MTYKVVKASDNSDLGGTWLTTGTGGAVQLNENVLGAETVKIKYTINGVDALTNSFTVKV